MTETINTVSLSRDSIRTKLIDNIKTYLELEQVDLTKTSFLSWVVDSLSTLTSNLLFYEISVFREFFMTLAQTPESIYNLAAFVGYSPRNATYSQTNVLLTFPLTFTSPDVIFEIPNGQVFRAGDLDFQTYYTTTISVTENTSVSAYITIETTDNEEVVTSRYNIPAPKSTNGDEETFSIVLTVRQYNIDHQEFQVDQDEEPYQFLEKELTFPSNLQFREVTDDITVLVTPPETTTAVPYTLQEHNSLFLMNKEDNEFVFKKTEGGIKIFFGNGLIGNKPDGGSKIEVDTALTAGSLGNVIAGSITSGDRIYFTDSDGITKHVIYTCTNPMPAIGGDDGETSEEVRRNAITHITQLNRLVTENDYRNITVALPDLPFSEDIIPILKRSDIQVNEIQLYSPLVFQDPDTGENGIVETRSLYHEDDDSVITWYNDSTGSIPAKSLIYHDSVYPFYTMFDMTFDTINKSASYTYAVNSISKTPALVARYSEAEGYDLIGTEIVVEKLGTDFKLSLKYTSDEEDYDECYCTVQMVSTKTPISIATPVLMINDSTNKEFYIEQLYSMTDNGEIDFYFVIYNTVTNVVKYSTKIFIKQDLSSFMKSNLKTSPLTIYDIPCISKDYYDNLEQNDWLDIFELNVIQVMLAQMITLSSARMLTDFINFKFTNTIGRLTNMYYNRPTIATVNAKDLTSYPPTTPNFRFIVSGLEGEDDPNLAGGWKAHKNKIAEWITIGPTSAWYFTIPRMNDIVPVDSTSELNEIGEPKQYIYSHSGWIYPDLSIPFDIEIEISRSSTYSGTISGLIDLVRSTLYTQLSELFGNSIGLYNSQIVDIVHGINGVGHCRVIKPECDIFFNYELKDLSDEELLRYGPEYIYTTEDNITITVI